MKYLIAGDLHITSKNPENRTDNYFETQIQKINYIVGLAVQNKATLLLPGDVFDSYKQSNLVLQTYINIFSCSEVPIFTVLGQHDMKYHSDDTDDTPLAVLEAANVLKIIPNNTPIYDELHIYRASFGEEIPEILDFHMYSILLTHRMIIHNDKIWDAQKGFDYAENLLRKHEFDLIVSGDNHNYFHAQVGNKHLFNCGSLMRATTAQLEHIPKVVLFDTETSKYKEFEVPIKPISEVFNLERIKEKKKRTDKFASFISGLSNTKSMSLSFEDNLTQYLKENKVEKGVADLLKEVVSE